MKINQTALVYLPMPFFIILYSHYFTLNKANTQKIESNQGLQSVRVWYIAMPHV